MNHLEQLVSEWLQYNGYFVRTSVLVGRRERGGFEGELDVIAFRPRDGHFVHIECSLDANPWEVREERFKEKFDRGAKYAGLQFEGLPTPEKIEHIAVVQVANATGDRRRLGGGRLITVRELINEIREGLKGTTPLKGAVSSNLPLLRTLQVAFDAGEPRDVQHRLIPLT